MFIDNEPLLSALEGIDFAEVCITSGIEIVEGEAPEGAFTLPDVSGVGVVPRKAAGRRCARSWRYTDDVGSDPDFPDIPLGGWAGTIKEVDQRSAPPTYLIEWDGHTLDHMHPVYRKRCERDGLELERMWLGEDDLEPDSGEPA